MKPSGIIFQLCGLLSNNQPAKKLKKGGVSNIGGLHKAGGLGTLYQIYIAAKLANANKTKQFITSQKLDSGDL